MKVSEPTQEQRERERDHEREQREHERERAQAERERARSERERIRSQSEEIRNQAKEHAREVREQARMVRDQAREIRDQAKHMADHQREIWRDFGEEIRSEIRSEIHGIPRRKPQQPSLSLDQIVRAAIEIADREGNDAISMRRIASELQVGAMSLYWHVANKDELIQLMVDETYAEMKIPEKSTGDWRTDIHLVASETRQIFLRHPWVAQVGPTLGAKMGPGFLRHAEFSFAAFEHTKVTKEMRSDIVHVVDDFTIGFATREITTGAWAAAGEAEQEKERTRTDMIFERIAKMGIFPVLTRLYREGTSFPEGEDLDRLFYFGLDSLLDGIAMRIADAERDGITTRIGSRFV
jgi:AcrR family transcriptional regulator